MLWHAKLTEPYSEWQSPVTHVKKEHLSSEFLICLMGAIYIPLWACFHCRLVIFIRALMPCRM